MERGDRAQFGEFGAGVPSRSPQFYKTPPHANSSKSAAASTTEQHVGQIDPGQQVVYRCAQGEQAGRLVELVQGALAA